MVGWLEGCMGRKVGGSEGWMVGGLECQRRVGWPKAGRIVGGSQGWRGGWSEGRRVGGLEGRMVELS
jgi:hypothetical protein